MPPCGVSKWRFIAIEFYGVLCCVYGLRDTRFSDTLWC